MNHNFVKVSEWMNSLIVHAKNIINDESCVPVQDFWQQIVQKNQFNEKAWSEFFSIRKIESEFLKKLSNQQRLMTKNTCKKSLKI